MGLKKPKRRSRRAVGLGRALRGGLYRRVRELDRLRTRLVANVSHELRTPLSLIRASTDRLLQKTEPDGASLRDLETIARSTCSAGVGGISTGEATVVGAARTKLSANCQIAIISGSF